MEGEVSEASSVRRQLRPLASTCGHPLVQMNGPSVGSWWLKV